MKNPEGTSRRFGVIVSALFASLVSAIYTAGIVLGCRAASCHESASGTLLLFLFPLGGLIAGPIVAARIARTSVSPLWLGACSSVLPAAAGLLGMGVALPAEESEAFAFAAAGGLGLAVVLAPVSGFVTAWRHKKRVEGGPGFGVIVSALCAALAAASCAVGIALGSCRGPSCEPEGPEMLFLSLFLVPLEALVAGPILAAQVARKSVYPPELAVGSFVLLVVTAMLGVLSLLPADAGYIPVFMAGFGVGLAVLLAPIAELVNQWRHKERVEAGASA